MGSTSRERRARAARSSTRFGRACRANLCLPKGRSPGGGGARRRARGSPRCSSPRDRARRRRPSNRCDRTHRSRRARGPHTGTATEAGGKARRARRRAPRARRAIARRNRAGSRTPSRRESRGVATGRSGRTACADARARERGGYRTCPSSGPTTYRRAGAYDRSSRRCRRRPWVGGRRSRRRCRTGSTRGPRYRMCR